MKSTFHGEAPIATWPIVVDEVTLVGSRCGPFRPAIELLASGAVQVEAAHLARGPARRLRVGVRRSPARAEGVVR